MKWLYIIQIGMKLFEVLYNWKTVWSYPKLIKDVPLGPNVNGATVVWPELI